MKKILYFDAFSGISGDMAVAAMLDLGVPLSHLRDHLSAVDLLPDDLDLSTRRVTRSAIAAVAFDVLVEGRAADRMPANRGGSGEHDAVHSHHHEEQAGHFSDDRAGDTPHQDHHSHGLHDHGEHRHGDDSGHHHHVTFGSIRRAIEKSDLPKRVQERAIDIFRAIAIGEADVHGMEVEEVGFHEVGAVDSIVDILSVALCLEYLEIDEVYASPIPLGGGGFVWTQHGKMPLPAPATIKILQGHPVTQTAIPFELTTPTGAGIVAALSRGQLPEEEMRIIGSGFGAGTRDLSERPNLLRATLAERSAEVEETIETDSVVEIEANIDDMSPELYPLIAERLFEAGALDVWWRPITMKGGRPAVTLSLLSAPSDAETLSRLLLVESSSIGCRQTEKSRRKLPRKSLVLNTPYGPVEYKEVEYDGGGRLSVEAREVLRVAREEGLPFPEIHHQLQSIGTEHLRSSRQDRSERNNQKDHS